MSFDTYEISNSAGRPISLYEFRYGNTYYRYCTADQNQIVGEDEDGYPAVWEALTISDDGVTQGGSDQNDLQVETQADMPIVAIFRNGQPSGKVWLSVRHWHIGDPDEETPLVWSGTVTNAVEVDSATYRLIGRSLAGTYDKQGLRLSWTRMCPHALYSDFGCKVDKDEHAYPRTIATLTGNGFTCTAHAEPDEGTFAGGFVEWLRTDGSLERRGIESQTGNDFRVMGSTSGLVIGTEVTIYPGCARTTATCKAFDNLPNYGGFPHLPGKSPFDGSPVF